MSQTHDHHNGHETPTARWVVGRDAFGSQTYVFHSAVPSFLAKVADDDETGVLSGLSYAMTDERSLYDFVWFDSPPSGKAFTDLMRLTELAVTREKTST